MYYIQYDQTVQSINELTTLNVKQVIYQQVFWLPLQVKKLKAQLDQKTQRNGTDKSSSPDGVILENGSDANIIDLQSENQSEASSS